MQLPLANPTQASGGREEASVGKVSASAGGVALWSQRLVVTATRQSAQLELGGPLKAH